MVTAKLPTIATLAITVAAAALMYPVGIRAAVGAPVQCVSGGDCKVGEYLYDDNYSLLTTGTCSVTSEDPSGSNFLTITGITSADGWYEYAFTAPSTTGYYPTQFCCNDGTNDICLDKSFEVVDSSTNPSASDIASAVWGYSGRTLTSFGDLVNSVWSNSDRSVTTFGTLAQDVWSHAVRTLTGAGLSEGQLATESSSTITISSQLTDIRLQLEQLVNQPIITNSISEETPDLSQKLDNTSESLSQLYIDHQHVVSKVGLVGLNWEKLSSSEVVSVLDELIKVIGRESDSQGSTLGQIAWLKKSWDWAELDDIYSQTKSAQTSLVTIRTLVSTSGKQATAYSELKLALKNLESAEKLIGESTDAAGTRTAYGRYKYVQGLAAAWGGKEQQVNKILLAWNKTDEKQIKSQSDSIYKEVMVLNQIPKADKALASYAKDISPAKQLKNRVLGILGLINANKTLLAKNQGSTLSSTWLEEGSVVFKTLVTNPSNLISQDVPLKYYLPAEVKEEDIIEHDPEVELKYDAEKGQMYAEGTITVAAGETKTISVRVDDKWQITQTEVDSMKTQVAELSKPLEKTAYFAQGVTLSSDINASLDKAISLQEAAVTPEQKIRAYREAEIEMASAQEKLAKLQELVTQAGSTGTLFGFVGGAQVLAVWGLIIIVVAGFVFLALYMRSISNATIITKPQKEEKKPKSKKGAIFEEALEEEKKPVKKNNRKVWWAAVHMLLFGAVSSATTAIVVRQMMLQQMEKMQPSAPVQQVSSAPTSAVLASEDVASASAEMSDPSLALGGQDIVQIVVPSGSAVNLREDTNLQSLVVTRIKATTEAVRLDQVPDWTQVEVNSQTGWVSTQFVKEPGEEDLTQVSPLEVVIGDTSSGWLRVRQEPNGKEIARVNSGETYPLLDQTSGWWQIELTDGSAGWVSKQYADTSVVQEVN